MTTGKKVGIGIGIAIILLAGLGLYGNNKLNQAIDSMVQSGLFGVVDPSGKSTGSSALNQAGGDDPASASQNGAGTQAPGSASNVGPEGTTPDPGGTLEPGGSGSLTDQPALTPGQNSIVTGAERYLGRKVDRRDVLTAGNIIISRFSWGEVNYLYGVGSRGLQGTKETHEVRNLLLSRLSGGDVATLTSIGNKYGLSLRILDPNWDIDQARYIN